MRGKRTGAVMLPGHGKVPGMQTVQRGRLGRLRWVATLGFVTSMAACAPRSTVRIAVAIEPWSEEGFTGRRLVTEHFEIISTLRDPEFEAALPGFLEACHTQYEAMILFPADVEMRLPAYIFGTRSEWARFSRRRFPARYDVYSRIRSGGFTEGATSVSFHVSRAATLATLAHEGWHQYIGVRLETPIPAWLNEGLACYHEAVEFAGATPGFTPQHNTFRINSLREAIQTDKVMTLQRIVDTDAGRVITRHHAGISQIYYAQAWALATFLRHGASGRHAPAFDRMLRDLADGTFAVRVSAATLGTAGAGDLSVGEAAFRAYFEHTPDQLADEYYDHLIRIAGF